jgi:hypothetical protein
MVRLEKPATTHLHGHWTLPFRHHLPPYVVLTSFLGGQYRGVDNYN